ncbi:MAG: helix-turn-helix domain-containing protein [Deltaproteobacteria bacterium]|nr:helix-turn-helix domain-containing protein [Deltaproteobacteria bacterium]
MPKLSYQLGHNIRALRDSLGLTQELLAEGADISLKHLGEIERGRGNPTLVTLTALAKALHVTLAELMSLGDERQPLDTSAIEIRALVEKQDKATRLRMLRVLKAMLAEK